MIHILLVEDDMAISNSLQFYLEKEGFQVDTAKGSKEVLQKLVVNPCHLVLLDVTLEEGDGFTLFSQIKKIRDIPVLFLTAMDDEINVIHGFELGADDYITKPFKAVELLLRVKAVLRRCSGNTDEILIQNLRINFNQAKVYKDQKHIFLTALEYKLLLTLVENKGKILTRERLLSNIWDVSEDFVNDNTLTVYIKRLREKIEDNPNQPTIIITVRGMGYKIGEDCGY